MRDGMLVSREVGPKVSIVIRTKNEERWLDHCLRCLASQNFRDFEVIIVDNESKDATVAIAKRHGIQKILTLTDYRPGKALNVGFAQASGQYVVCLSAHCLPKGEHWLNRLVAGFEDETIAGVYGRQLPVAFTPPTDKRDLLITFGRDRRVQIKDYFFHNANSAIRRVVWQAIPFDNEATNIEDRIWAKAVLARGYKILYEPEAEVYHHHGIHQNNETTRAVGTVSIIEQVEGREEINSLPSVLQPAGGTSVAVVPVTDMRQVDGGNRLLERAIKQLHESAYIQKIFVLAQSPHVMANTFSPKVHFLQRPAELEAAASTLEDVLRVALGLIEDQGIYPSTIIYVNYLYPFRPRHLFDDLLNELHYKGLDTVFPAHVDYNNYWAQTESGDFTQVGDGLKRRQQKDPVYKSLYGVGTAVVVPLIRQGKLVGEKVGIIPLEPGLYDLKYEEGVSAYLISLLLQRSPEMIPKYV